MSCQNEGRDILQSKISLTGPGLPFGEEGAGGEPRAPPPGYPGAGQIPRMPHGPMPGSGERWPQQHMVRPPHPGQVRPGKVYHSITLWSICIKNKIGIRFEANHTFNLTDFEISQI